MTCWPPCGPWCDCINGRCQLRGIKINVVRLRTPDGRYLTAINGGGAGLRADRVVPSPQFSTFWLVSRPTTAPLTIPPPATLPMPSGSQISLVVCSPDWSPSANLVRAEYSVIYGRLINSFYFGGPGKIVLVMDTGFAGASHPAEWIFSMQKAGGGGINSGDEVSLQIDSGRTDFGPFYFRASSGADRALIGADGVAPFQPDTTFVVEFHEVDPAFGFRPPDNLIVCQICGPVTGTVTEVATRRPIPNARVEAQGVLENHPFGGTTDMNGRFTLLDPEGRNCIPPGNVTLQAYANRYQRRTTGPIPDPSAGGADVPISLECTVVVGTVVNNSNPGIPIQSEQVTFVSDDGTSLSTRTNEDGVYLFACVPHGPATVSFSIGEKRINVPPEGATVPPHVLPWNCIGVSGTVTDKNTGLPVCNVTVRVGVNFTTKTNAQGNYRIRCASPVSSYLRAEKSGYVTYQEYGISLPSSGSIVKNIEIEPTTGSIPGLFNTGVDACGAPLPDGTIGDPHYVLFSVPGGTTNIRVRTAAGGYPIPPYIEDNLISAWIVPDNDVMGNGPSGLYVYRITFNLTGFVLSSAAITGKWSTDNDGVRIELNGVDTGNPPTSYTQFADGFAPFSIRSGFLPGRNTLDFIVNNGGGSTALRVEMTSTASR